jgi:hypothetical protein
MAPGSVIPDLIRDRGEELLKDPGCVRGRPDVDATGERGPVFSFIPPIRHSCESRNPCYEAEGILKFSGNLPPFDMDPGSSPG